MYCVFLGHAGLANMARTCRVCFKGHMYKCNGSIDHRKKFFLQVYLPYDHICPSVGHIEALDEFRMLLRSKISSLWSILLDHAAGALILIFSPLLRSVGVIKKNHILRPLFHYYYYSIIIF